MEGGVFGDGEGKWRWCHDVEEGRMGDGVMVVEREEVPVEKGKTRKRSCWFGGAVEMAAPWVFLEHKP